MDATIADEKSDDVEILIKNWKKIPVIGTQVLMSNFLMQLHHGNIGI